MEEAAILTSREALTDPYLEVRGVEVTYEKVEIAIRGVSVRVAKGEVCVVLGANGSGKTTLLRAISGFLPGERAAVTDGHIIFDGERIDGWSPHRTANKGVVMVPERDKIFTTLTVEENLRVGRQGADRDRLQDLQGLVYEMFPVLRQRGTQTAGYLSGGERQMLACASALLCDPSVLLIDELSLGLAPSLARDLFGLVREIAVRRGLTVLMVEQNAVAALQIADYVYILETGRIVLDGTPERMMKHEDVREFYLGLSEGDDSTRSFARVKQYKRRRRWWG
jgi:branched-chain amino acid transport system ATP-binding protein